MENSNISKVSHFHRIIDTYKDINQLVVDENNPTLLIRKTCEILVHTRGYYFAWVGLFNANKTIRLIESAGAAKGLEKLKADAEQGILPELYHKALDKKEFAVYTSRQNDCPIEIEQTEWTSFVAPIYVDSEIEGLVCASIPNQFAQHPKEKETFKNIATSIGSTLARINTQEKLAIIQQKANENEEKYRGLMNALSDSVFILQDGLIKYVNTTLCTVSEYSEEELLNSSITKFIEKSEVDKIMTMHSQRMAGLKVPSNYESIAITKLGKIIPVETIITQVDYEGKPAYQVILRDVREKRQRIEKLKESEERYWFLSESAFEGILIHDQGTIIDVNQKMVDMSNYAKEELIGKSVFEYLVAQGNQIEELIRNFAQVETKPFVSQIKLKNGDVGYIQIEARQIQYNGKIVRIAGLRNVSEQYKLNQSINDTREQLNNLLNNLPGMAYTCQNSKNWDMEFLSQGCFELTGYSPNEIINIPGAYNAIIHPSDLHGNWDAIQKNIEANQTFEIEYRIVTKQGKIKWVWERGNKVDRNNTILIEGFITDVTERKRAEGLIQKSAVKYQNLFNAINDAILIHPYEEDKVLPFSDTNEQACKLYGYTRKELLKRNVRDITPSTPHNLLVSKENKKALQKQGWMSCEIEQQKKNGKIIPVEIRTQLFETEGKTMAISLVHDISSRKLAQDKLHASEHLQQMILQSMPVGFLMIDNKHIIKNINEQTCKITGHTKQDLVGKKCDIICTHDMNCAKCPVRKAPNEAFSSKDTFVKCKDGSIIPVLKNAQTITINGEEFILESFIDNSKHKEAEQLLLEAKIMAEENQQKFTAFMNFLPGQAYIKDKDSKFMFVNRFMEKNLKAKTWLGKNPNEVLPAVQLKKAFVNDKETFKLGRHKFEENFPVIDRGVRDFLTYQFTINANNSQPLLGGISIDITERKKLESTNLMLSKAIGSSPVSIVITNKEGDIEYVNPFFEQKTGYKLDEIKGQNPRLLKSGNQDDDFYKDLWSTIASGKVWYGVFHNKTKNGELFWEHASISPILNDKGEIIQFVGIKEDVTEKKQTLKNLQEAKEKAEESDKLKSSFLANMSHEIRTPMNGILGFSELLKEPNLSGDEQTEFIEVIQKSGERMLTTINDIIDISKIESGMVEVKYTTIELVPFLNDIYFFFLPETRKKDIELIFENADDTSHFNFQTDTEKLHSIITNLIKNAIKFTHQGNISFGFETKMNQIDFFIRDTGIGIPKSRQKAIFERFIQADIADSRVYEGSGLGLSISKSYTELLGGKIQLESEVEKGTSFRISLPWQNPIPTTKNMEVDSGNQNTSTGVQLKILIAEDDLVSVELLQLFLKPVARDIITVGNGKLAIEMVRNHPEIDLVLMDIKMPIMDGIEATTKIREFNTNIKIVAQTAFAHPDDAMKADEAGCNDFITKPIKKQDLLQKIRSLFHNS